MSLYCDLMSNTCLYCRNNGVTNGHLIDSDWRDTNNCGIWPKPYKHDSIESAAIKGIIIGQDPTISSDRPLEYVLEANKEDRLGQFLREIADMLPDISFDDLYFTNLIKCRLSEKPGKDNRNISTFLHDMAGQCYKRFLESEIALYSNARLMFTLGRDTFNMMAELLHMKHESLASFHDYCATPLEIPPAQFGRQRLLIPLPHLPTYDTANRYLPYSRDILKRKLGLLKSLVAE